MSPIDRRSTMLRVWVMQMARAEIKAQLKRRNCQPCHYAQREISLMAEQWLQAGHWRELREQALAQIMSSPRLKAEWDREGLKYEAAMARRKAAA
jgi:hypothetical protein